MTSFNSFAATDEEDTVVTLTLAKESQVTGLPPYS